MNDFIESILIPTDASEGALAGAKHGVALASQTDADVHVISVVEEPTSVGIPDEDTIQSLESAAQEALETVVEMVESVDERVSVTTAVEHGTPFQSIRAYANRREIDVIVMGTKGRTGLDRMLLGSVTENVLRTARTPVLAVPPAVSGSGTEEISFERFLLPTDGSDGAQIAAEWGIALADRLDAMIHSLFVVDTSPFAGTQSEEELFEAFEDQGQAAIDDVGDRARAAGVGVSGSIATGSPAKATLASAADIDADLIIMGTHGQTGIGQWFLGSVTENVVRQSPRPVFCVPVSAEAPNYSTN